MRMRALSLVSIAPIKTACGSYHVYVSLGGEQRVTTMNIYRTQEGGGNFVAPLAVNARLTFIPVKPGRNKAARKLALDGSFTFPASPIPWSVAGGAMAKRTGSVTVDTDGDLIPDTPLPGTSNFSPGSLPDRRTLSKGFGDYGDCPCWDGHSPATPIPAPAKSTARHLHAPTIANSGFVGRLLLIKIKTRAARQAALTATQLSSALPEEL